MAHGKHSARLEEWLTDLRILIMWALRDRQPHGREELTAWLITSLNMGWETKSLRKILGIRPRIAAELKRLVSHRICVSSQDQGVWKIALVLGIKAYQRGVDALVSLERNVGRAGMA